MLIFMGLGSGQEENCLGELEDCMYG